MINNNDLIELYNDYDNVICLPTTNRDGIGYILEPKINNEPNPVPVAWVDIKNVNMKSSVIKNGMVRFLDKEIEDEAYRLLRINVSNGSDCYTRDRIESMILNPNDSVLQEIIEIRDLKVIDLMNSILVGLENSNAYDISNRVALYIRARKEELENKQVKSELEVTPVKKIEVAVVENKEVEETPKKKTAPSSAKKKSASKAKTTKAK